MIDSTKSPVPAWKRYATIALLVILVVVVAFVVYTKELHHNSTSAPPPAPAPATTAPAPSPAHLSVPTTIPGGIAISNRNPFQ